MKSLSISQLYWNETSTRLTGVLKTIFRNLTKIILFNKVNSIIKIIEQNSNNLITESNNLLLHIQGHRGLITRKLYNFRIHFFRVSRFYRGLVFSKAFFFRIFDGYPGPVPILPRIYKAMYSLWVSCGGRAGLSKAATAKLMYFFVKKTC